MGVSHVEDAIEALTMPARGIVIDLFNPCWQGAIVDTDESRGERDRASNVRVRDN